MQFGRRDRFAGFHIVGHDDADDVAALELARKTGRKALDGDAHGLLRTVQIVEIGVFGCGCVGELGRQDVIANSEVGDGVFTHDGSGVMEDICGKIVGTDLHGLNHIRRDLFPSAYGLGDPDDFFLLTDGSVEEGCNTEADQQRDHNADHADDCPVFENTHADEPPIR